MLLNRILRLRAKTRYSAAAMTVLLLFISTLLLNAVTSSLTGTVIDTEGAAMGKAHIFIRVDSAGRKAAVQSGDLMLETDERGRFFANLAPGFYDVCIMADAFSPYCQKVLVTDTPFNLKAKMRADPEVIRRLGDRF